MELLPTNHGCPDSSHTSIVFPLRVDACEQHTVTGKDLRILAVKLVAVAMPLADVSAPIGCSRSGVRFEHAIIGSKAHRATKALDAALIGHVIGHRMRSRRVELSAVGTRKPAYIARELDDGALHPHAYAEEGTLALRSNIPPPHLAFPRPWGRSAGHSTPWTPATLVADCSSTMVSEFYPVYVTMTPFSCQSGESASTTLR